jgi:hypothetical protein
MLFDCLDNFVVVSPAFDTQNLCVSSRSVVTVLGRSGHGGDKFTLASSQIARDEHDLSKQLSERRTDARVSHQQTTHRREKSEVIGMPDVRRHLSPHVLFGGDIDLCRR